MKSNRLKFKSICSREWTHLNQNEPHILPIYNTSAFVFDQIEDGIAIFEGKADGYVYSRYGNPTINTVAAKIAALEAIDGDEPAYGLLCGSGMGAISTSLLSFLQHGDRVITQADLYGGTTELMQTLLRKLGVEVIQCNLRDKEQIESNIAQGKVKMIYCESPSNPLLACVDLEMISTLCEEHGLISMIDNTFASSYLQRPFNHGFDVVIYSTTKYLNGHGNALGGAIITKDQDKFTSLWNTLKLTGAYASPTDAWLLYNGLKTFPMRMEQHCDNAEKLAAFLNAHPKVKRVNYPGLTEHQSHTIAAKQMFRFGGMMSFELDGDTQMALKFMNGVKMATLAPTLGNIDTLLLHPASSSHLKVDKAIREPLGITDGLIRVSVGTEDPDDLITDFEESLSEI